MLLGTVQFSRSGNGAAPRYDLRPVRFLIRKVLKQGLLEYFFFKYL